jgi:hypothetical protein
MQPRPREIHGPDKMGKSLSEGLGFSRAAQTFFNVHCATL